MAESAAILKERIEALEQRINKLSLVVEDLLESDLKQVEINKLMVERFEVQKQLMLEASK